MKAVVPPISLLRGIKQHWSDDEWFHRSVAFHEVSSEIGVLFKDAYGSGDGFRSGFIGHICMEMLIDAVLTERNPGALDQYYDTIQQIDFAEVEAAINGFGAKPTEMVKPFLKRYCEDQFLRDYTDDAKLLWRLNRVPKPSSPRRPAGCRT